MNYKIVINYCIHYCAMLHASVLWSPIPWAIMHLVAGARTWNALPADILCAPSLNTFKKHLKSHLFSATTSYNNLFVFSNCLLLCILCTVIICTVLATSPCKHVLYWLLDHCLYSLLPLSAASLTTLPAMPESIQQRHAWKNWAPHRL